MAYLSDSSKYLDAREGDKQSIFTQVKWVQKSLRTVKTPLPVAVISNLTAASLV